MKYVFIVIIIILIMIIISLIRRNKYCFELLSNYEAIIEEQGKKNHEYNNQLLIITGYLNNKTKLKNYLQTIIDDHRTGQNFEVRQLSHIPAGGIKNLLYFKFKKMNELKIKNYLYVHEDVKEIINNIKLNNYKDLTKLLGVLIDNSIDAAKKAKEKEISIDFKLDGKYLLVVISNTIDEGDNLKKIGKKGYTTKGEGHGYGLLLVKDIIRHNKRFELVTNYDNKNYTQTVLYEY